MVVWEIDWVGASWASVEVIALLIFVYYFKRPPKASR